jgi:crotonobetainyl-CoA:carnitine CoA-transferase CaiB-like acyl-CoA transferase
MPRVGNQHPFTAPYDAYAARDGYVAIGTASNRLFRRLCEAIGKPGLAADARYKDHRGRSKHRHAVNAEVAAWIAERTCDEAIAVLGPKGAHLPCARVAAPHELLDDPQLVARGMIERQPHPTLGEVVFHGNPLRFEGAEPRPRALAPALGEHNAEVFSEIGVDAAELSALAERGVV